MYTNELGLSEFVPESASPNLGTLNNDCQQLILDYLEFKDLLNVAETSKTLNMVACDVFKRKYGQKYVGLLFGFLCDNEEKK